MKTFYHFVSLSLLNLLLIAGFNAQATKWTVNVQNFSFSPSDLPNVSVGDTIRWVWINGSHTTTSTSVPGGAASWDHPINSSNTFYEYPVTVAGVYNYHCTPHAGMGMVGSFTAAALTPVLVSIVPNQAVQGDTFMATITGQNTNFNGSPSVSMTFSNNPSETINATSVTVISPTVLHAMFTIPVSASAGLWDVHVNSLLLNDGFTVVQAVPAITFMDPNSAHQGDSFNGTIYGQNTSWTGTPSVYLSFSSNPSEQIQGTNVMVVNSTQLTADFSVPGDASTGNYTVHVDALQQANGFTVLAALTPVLTNIVPDNGVQGTLVSTSITAENTTFEGGTPNVSLNLSGNPAEIINGTNVVVVNNTTLTADFNIPDDATPGLYDLNVDDLSLQNSFTVTEAAPYILSIVPDSANQGEMVMSTILAEHSHFTASEPTVFLSFSSNPIETIASSMVSVMSDNEIEVMFEIPLDASVGKYDLHVGSMVLTQGFTVNLVSGINDPSLLSIRTYPNPATTSLSVENASGSYLSIYDILGNKKLNIRIDTDKQIVDLSGFAKGVYLIHFNQNNTNLSRQLVIN